MDEQSLTYKEVPDNQLQARILTNVSPTDWWVMLFSVLIVAATSIWTYQLTRTTVPSILLAMFECLIFLVIMYRMRLGFYRVYGEIYHGVVKGMKHKIVGGILWKANDTDRWIVRWLRDRNGRRPALPYSLSVIKAEIDGKVERIAVLRELDQPYDHVFFICEGGSFVTHDSSMQMRLVDELANITNRAVSMADLKLGIAYLRVQGPADDTVLRDFFGSNMNPMIAHPELFDLDEDTLEWVAKMQQTVNELRPATHLFGAGRPRAVVQLTIKRDRQAWQNARKGKLSNEELYDLPVVELSRTMAEALATNSLYAFQSVKVLGLADLAELIRVSYDIADIQGYYEDRRNGKVPVTDDEIDEIVEKEGLAGLNARLQCWPRKIIQLGPNGKWLRIDGTYFSVLRITQIPKRVRAEQVLNLHFLAPAGVWTRIATVGQSISGNTETRNLIVQASAMANVQHAFFSHRIVTDPRRRRKQQQVDSQTEEISANTIAQSFNILVVVAATSARDVLRHRRTMKGNMLVAGYDSQFVDDVPYVQNAVHSGVLAVNRM